MLLATQIGAFHKSAETNAHISTHGSPEAIEAVIAQNFEQTLRYRKRHHLSQEAQAASRVQPGLPAESTVTCWSSAGNRAGCVMATVTSTARRSL